MASTACRTAGANALSLDTTGSGGARRRGRETAEEEGGAGGWEGVADGLGIGGETGGGEGVLRSKLAEQTKCAFCRCQGAVIVFDCGKCCCARLLERCDQKTLLSLVAQLIPLPVLLGWLAHLVTACVTTQQGCWGTDV